MRCFIALPLPAEARERLADFCRRARKIEPEWRWVDPGSLHLTLAFLGDIEGAALECATLAAEAAAGMGVFDLTPVRMTGFPSGSRPRVIALELKGSERDGEDACASLWLRVNRRLAQECGRAGIGNPNRDWDGGRLFRPHVTVARAKTGALRPDCAELWRVFSESGNAPIRIGECILYGSELKPSGAVHTELTRAALGTTDTSGRGER